MTTLPKRLLIGTTVALTLVGCALFGKSEPAEWRYFDVEAESAYQGSGGEQHLKLRLGTVKAARHLDRRIVSRPRPHELTYYEELRWTEAPDEFVRRALTHSLYEQAGVSRVVSGVAPTLEVELTAFDEVKDGTKRRARVALHTVLYDDRHALAQNTVEVDVEVGDVEGDEVHGLVAALGSALGQAITRVTEHTLRALAEQPAPRADALAPPVSPTGP